MEGLKEAVGVAATSSQQPKDAAEATACSPPLEPRTDPRQPHCQQVQLVRWLLGSRRTMPFMSHFDTM